MTQEFDPNWPHGHVTRIGGLPVRIYATDGVPQFTIHGALKTANGWEAASLNPNEIINAPAPVVREVRWCGVMDGYTSFNSWVDRKDIRDGFIQHLRLTFENGRCVEVKIFDKDQVDE